ncbi:MAG TPA: undecaprenyldiphospho-muramoylpentapeptide beta-N-acetylglucosaminyltransferase, partial [Elusimicrobiota bacterium]|nr:undecaprenyldiphospho-muramoylpentapeptide beta-N-acetylglucosaminyltransferase [Elusimicrobiota bacterium]
ETQRTRTMGISVSSAQTVLIVAGGTGGHLYPGIAVAQALRDMPSRSANVIFVVRTGDLGKAILAREGFQCVEIPGQGLPRRPSFGLLTFAWTLASGYLAAWRCLGQCRPAVVVGMGGYLSFPVMTAARFRGIRTIIHEQNVLPGLSNRWLARAVDSVAISFVDSARYFPAAKTWLAGLPVRQEIGTVQKGAARQSLGLVEDRFTVLVFGGSQGAHRMNEEVLNICRQSAEELRGMQMVHVTGEKDYDKLAKEYSGSGVRAIVMPYCHNMAAAYAAADLVVCRAGASTVAELERARRPSILIPYPFASEDHQRFNAEHLVNLGLADMILERDLGEGELRRLLLYYARNPAILSDMEKRFPETCNSVELPAVKLAQVIAGFFK